MCVVYVGGPFWSKSRRLWTWYYIAYEEVVDAAPIISRQGGFQTRGECLGDVERRKRGWVGLGHGVQHAGAEWFVRLSDAVEWGDYPFVGPEEWVR